jgi:agmatinase
MDRHLIEFLGVDPEHTAYQTSQAVVLPFPWEQTVSYGHGTARGPEAILRASHQVETWDEIYRDEPYLLGGIATVPAPDLMGLDAPTALGNLESLLGRILDDGKFPLVLGGEHSLSIAGVRAAAARSAIGVVQFDAHADLRDSYDGTPHSHASVMKRVVDLGVPTLAYGIRALSPPEDALIHERGLATIWGHEIDAADAATRFAQGLAQLPHDIFLTFDIDFFDPAFVPSTGTPEPGGGRWYPTLSLLATLFSTKNVVGADLVELAPVEGHPASDFLAARLAYKILGLALRARRTASNPA